MPNLAGTKEVIETEIKTSEAASLERSSLPPQQNYMDSLATALEPTETLWLGENKSRFIALYRPALAAAQMAIILMPDSPHKMAQHSLMHSLYAELPITGWSTLHIALPKVAETATESNSYIAVERISTSINFLISQGANSTALVAENHSAQQAISAAISQAKKTSGLVLWRVTNDKIPLAQLKNLAKSQITVLDVVDHTINTAIRAERIRRFKLAGFTSNYRLITSPVSDAGIKHTQRRVREWLETRFKKF